MQYNMWPMQKSKLARQYLEPLSFNICNAVCDQCNKLKKNSVTLTSSRSKTPPGLTCLPSRSKRK